jgi:hypothetical protein
LDTILFEAQRRHNNISDDNTFACEEIIDLVFFGVHWDELCHWLTEFRNYHGFAFGMHFIHDREAF